MFILIDDLNTLFGDYGYLLDPLDIQNSARALQCSLLNWRHNSRIQINALEDALCIAIIMFIDQTVRETTSGSSPLHALAIQRLKEALSSIPIRPYGGERSDVFLWILTIGAIASLESVERSWYVREMLLVCSDFNVESAEALIGRLHYWGWVSLKLDGPVHSLWDTMIRSTVEM